jgi:NAD-dependent SIR2 family protein deacetylase
MFDQRRIPEGSAAALDGLENLTALLAERRVLVLTGAGISTESGIPDYRSPESLARARTPVTYQAFTRSAAVRQRYWARSVIGWPSMRSRLPNVGHQALSQLEDSGKVQALITQNVDGLHHAAGNRNVVELHGALREVRCLGCGRRGSRDALQERLLALNPDFQAEAAMAPDGDAELSQDQIDGFRLADCEDCQGMLKPDGVFFGENVPPERVAHTWRLLDEAEVLLVLGSSLSVRSGYRLIEAAVHQGKPVAIINDGETRADPVATVRLSGRLGELLSALQHRL